MSDDPTPVALLREKADTYSKLAAQYRKAADVLERGLNPGSTPIRARAARRAGGDPKRSTMAMIELVLGSANEPLDPATLTERMKHDGWETESVSPLNTVRTALARLLERGQVERTDTGEFVWVPPQTAPQPAEPEATPQQEVLTTQE